MSLGLQVYGPPGGSRRAVEEIVAAEAAGVRQVWMAQPPVGPDALGVLGAAATRTTDVLLGTSVVPVFPRHPLVTASQALTVAELSEGRLRLGLGTSHRELVSGIHGLPFERPQGYLREYVHIVRSMLTDGAVDFDGEHLAAHATAAPAVAPILVAALGEKGFRLAGEISDGAMPWLCPLPYLVDVAAPALRSGAKAAGRRVPPLLAHVLISSVRDRDTARAAAVARMTPNAKMPFYAQMLARAGLPVDEPGGIDRAAEALLVSGEPAEIAERLQELLASGIDELLLSPVYTSDPEAEFKLILAVVGGVS